jgi:hypothetical protein
LISEESLGLALRVEAANAFARIANTYDEDCDTSDNRHIAKRILIILSNKGRFTTDQLARLLREPYKCTARSVYGLKRRGALKTINKKVHVKT